MEILLGLILILLVLVVFGHMTKSVLATGLSYTRKCPSCRTSIHGHARICPHCREATGWVTQKPGPVIVDAKKGNRQAIIGSVAIVAAIIGFILMFSI
jgi:hypothetical protein